MADNPHNGHRRRELDKFRRFGMDIFSDHEALEVLLYFAIRQGDTNPAAHRLMDRFGSLHAVFEAPPEQLQEVEGIGPHSADLIKFVYALIGRYQADVASMERNRDKLTSTERVGEYFAPQFAGEQDEVLLAAYLYGTGRVLKCEEIARGGHTHVPVDAYKIARGALLCGAVGVAVAHNHPNGAPVPSEADIQATYRLRDVLEGLGLELVDHCVVARGKYASIRRACGIKTGWRV